MSEIRLKIQCIEDIDHAKILKIEGQTRDQVEVLGGLLCGTSPFYIHLPGPGSPIGKCALCGGKLEYEIQDFEAQA